MFRSGQLILSAVFCHKSSVSGVVEGRLFLLPVTTCTLHLEHLLVCIVKRARWAGYMVIHSVCLLRSMSDSTSCPLRPLLLFVMELWSIGDKVFYKRPIEIQRPAKVAGHLDNGHMELEHQ